MRQQFTAKERDNETALDYFGARYYASAQGRFTNPDPLLGSSKVQQPQSWNRYAYSLNSPLRYTDPTGMFVWDASLGGTNDDKKVSDKIRKKRVEIRAAIAKANEALKSGKLNSTQKAEKPKPTNEDFSLYSASTAEIVRVQWNDRKCSGKLPGDVERNEF